MSSSQASESLTKAIKPPEPDSNIRERFSHTFEYTQGKTRWHGKMRRKHSIVKIPELDKTWGGWVASSSRLYMNLESLLPLADLTDINFLSGLVPESPQFPTPPTTSNGAHLDLALLVGSFFPRACTSEKAGQAPNRLGQKPEAWVTVEVELSASGGLFHFWKLKAIFSPRNWRRLRWVGEPNMSCCGKNFNTALGLASRTCSEIQEQNETCMKS